MSRQQSFLARLVNRKATAAAKPDAHRTVRRLQQNFESLENRQLLATMAGLEMAPGEVTDQQQIAVNTSSESLAERDVHQASDQQASAAIPDTLADSLTPAVDINKTDVNTKHLDHLLTSPEIERSLDQLARGLEMQPDFSSLYGLAEEVQADLEQFMDFVESQVLWQDITARTWSDGSQSFWTGDTPQGYVIDPGADTSGANWEVGATAEDGSRGTAGQKTSGGYIFQWFTKDGDDHWSIMHKSQQSDPHWRPDANADDDDDNRSLWERVVDLFSKDDDETESGSDDEEDPDACFPKPWWDEYGINSISDIAGTDLLLSNPLQTQDVAEFFLNQGDGQFLQAMDMIHTQNLWQM